jgi:tRNA threonylcarbamoyladenosine modification (KEOPS) complex  Pcc1 subunit
MNTLEVEIPLDKNNASIVLEAVGLETLNQANERSNVSLSYNGCLKMRIEADDLNAMRAALNTHLRLIDTAIKLINE